MKKPCAFPGIGRAPNLTTTFSSDKSAAEQALKIKREVRLHSLSQRPGPARQPQPASQTAEAAARKLDHVVQIGIPAENGRPFGIDEPAQSCLRPMPFQAGHRGECMDDVAQGAWLDDQNRCGTLQRSQSFQCPPGMSSSRWAIAPMRNRYAVSRASRIMLSTFSVISFKLYGFAR